MTLTELYIQDTSGLPTKEALALKRLYHHAARSFLHELCLTSDPIPPPPRRIEDNGLEGRYRETWVVETIPLAALFRSRGWDELVQLYRVTKPKKAAKR